MLLVPTAKSLRSWSSVGTSLQSHVLFLHGSHRTTQNICNWFKQKERKKIKRERLSVNLEQFSHRVRETNVRSIFNDSAICARRQIERKSPTMSKESDAGSSSRIMIVYTRIRTQDRNFQKESTLPLLPPPQPQLSPY